MQLHRFSQVQPFLDRAESWLLSAEAENNLLLGITKRLLRGDHGFEDPIYLATVETKGAVSGCAIRTPPFELALTQMPEAAIPLLLRDLVDVYPSLSDVFGPEMIAARFAKLWTKEFGGTPKLHGKERLYSLERVVPPSSPPSGLLRLAEHKELELVVNWHARFCEEQGLPDRGLKHRAEQLVKEGSLFLWEDGIPRSTAAIVAETHRGARVGYVYTPQPFRGHGYASICVAQLSQRLLEQGRRFCCLYADLANPTSNSIYKRLGYESVCDVAYFKFV